MDKEKNISRAKEIFAAHSGKDEVHFAADGQAFFNESDRNNHQRTLTGKATQTVRREDVMPSEPDLDDDDDHDDDFAKEKVLPVKDEKKGKKDKSGNKPADETKADKAADADESKSSAENADKDDSASNAGAGDQA